MDTKEEKHEMPEFRISNSTKTYVVDWSKINNLLDLIDLLKGLNFKFFAYNENHQFKDLVDKGLIVLSVPDLVEKYGHKIKNGNVIDLGWQNGWGKDTIDLHRQLFDRQEPGTYTRSGSASNQTFGFTVVENGENYNVVYKLDSGD